MKCGLRSMSIYLFVSECRRMFRKPSEDITDTFRLNFFILLPQAYNNVCFLLILPLILLSVLTSFAITPSLFCFYNKVSALKFNPLFLLGFHLLADYSHYFLLTSESKYRTACVHKEDYLLHISWHYVQTDTSVLLLCFLNTA